MVITGINIKTIASGIFKFYQLEVSSLYEYEKSMDEWVIVSQTGSASISNFGKTTTLLPKAFIRLNRNYRLSLEQSTDLDNLIINKSDFNKLFFDKKNTFSNTILLKPEILINKFLTFFQTKFSIDKKYYSTLFPEKMTYNPFITAQIINNLEIFNPINFLTMLYNSIGIVLFQELPDLSGDDPDFKSSKMYITDLISINDLEFIPNQGVISINEAIDFTKIKKFMSFDFGADGSIQPVNPFTSGELLDSTLLKNRIERLNLPFQEQTAFLGSDIDYPISAPLFSFFSNILLSYDINKDDLNVKSGSGSAEAEPTLADIYKAKPDNKLNRNFYNGQAFLLKLFRNVASIKNVKSYISTNTSFIGAIPHMSLTPLTKADLIEDENSDDYEVKFVDTNLMVQKFNKETLEYKNDKPYKTPSGMAYLDSVSIERKPNNGDEEQYITNATIIQINYINKYLLPKKKDKKHLISQLNEYLKKLYSDVDKKRQELVEKKKQKKKTKEKEIPTNKVAAKDDYIDIMSLLSYEDVKNGQCVDDALDYILPDITSDNSTASGDGDALGGNL